MLSIAFVNSKAGTGKTTSAEVYAQSYGAQELAVGADPWRNVAADLNHRAEIAEMTR